MASVECIDSNKKQKIKNFLYNLESHFSEIGLNDDEIDRVLNDASFLKKEISSEQCKISILKCSLISIQSMLESIQSNPARDLLIREINFLGF